MMLLSVMIPSSPFLTRPIENDDVPISAIMVTDWSIGASKACIDRKTKNQTVSKSILGVERDPLGWTHSFNKQTGQLGWRHIDRGMKSSQLSLQMKSRTCTDRRFITEGQWIALSWQG